jgi:sulfite reductase (ferredoxin)
MSAVDDPRTFGRARLSCASEADIDEFGATLERAMRRLADAGLTTREACGNSARNITACPYAGVAADEPFDVTPYADALTRYLLRHPLSAALPRKFKVAFEGCSTDHIATAVNDLGFRAIVGPNGGRGFRVTAGGDTAIMTTSAGLMHAFLPASEILRVAEAVLCVFQRLGDCEHTQRNRMQCLIKTLGWVRWREAYDRELTACRLRGQVPTIEIDPPASEPRPVGMKGGDLQARRHPVARPQ